MLPIRIAIAGTFAAALLGAAIASATAQTATEPVGKPLPLLQFVHPKGKTKPLAHPKAPAQPKITARAERKPERKLAVRPHIERHMARRAIAAPHKVVAAAPQAPEAIAAAAQTPALGAADALPANTSTSDTAAPGMAGTFVPPQATPPVSTEPVVGTDPNEIAAGGHNVQPVPPDQANAVDPAADNHAQTASEQTANEQTANEQPPNTAAPTAIVARAAVEKPDTPSPVVGSSSWIAQVLAALGGALTAGVVAWFLIWPAPIRTSA